VPEVNRMAWDARAWVAEVLGCGRDDLSIVRRVDDDETQVSYGHRGGLQVVARLVVAGPIRLLDETPGGHWEVTLKLVDGTFHHPPKEIRDSTAIEF
jgi:hypothetical protein